jgi:hypothetical protein
MQFVGFTKLWNQTLWISSAFQSNKVWSDVLVKRSFTRTVSLRLELVNSVDIYGSDNVATLSACVVRQLMPVHALGVSTSTLSSTSEEFTCGSTIGCRVLVHGSA